MKCPEQKVWGGVLRKYSWQPLGTKGTVQYRFARIMFPAFVWYTRIMWRKIAREVVSEMKDWTKSGYEIVGVIGIATSPSCGVNTTFDLPKSFEFSPGLKLEDLEREYMSNYYLEHLTISGEGVYFSELKKEMKKNNIKVRFYEHDPFSDIKGQEVEFAL